MKNTFISEIKVRDAVYRRFLELLKLENLHKMYLKNRGFLESSIKDELYRTASKNYIKRRIRGNVLFKRHNLAKNTRSISKRRF